jgi:hypothetical protein
MTRYEKTRRALVQETALPVINAPNIGVLDRVCLSSTLKVVMYVNQSFHNFSALRYPDLMHVFLTHGESDKTTFSASNQVKAYDLVFVAGEAAVRRYWLSLLNYDVDEHLRTVGRPQLATAEDTSPRSHSGRTTVLYAPTWEGDRPSVAYSSVESHGPTLVDALLRSPTLTLIYRPHPRTGWLRPEARTADRRLRRAVRDAARKQPQAGHRVDLDPQFGPQMNEADVMICDVSAVAMDFLTTGKPLIVTEPVQAAATVDRSGALGAVYNLPVSHAHDIASLVEDWVKHDVKRDERARWVEHHFGDLRPGASMRRFLDACEEAIQLRDRLVEEKRCRLAAGS